jgi:hypothetical protein
LELRRARVFSPKYFEDIFARASALVELVVHPVYYPYIMNVKTCESCLALMRAGSAKLRVLEIRGTGAPASTCDIQSPQQATRAVQTIEFGHLERLVFTGPMIFPPIHAPSLRSLELEDPSWRPHVASGVTRLSEATLAALTRLVWSTPVDKLIFPTTFPHLRDLTWIVRDIHMVDDFTLALSALRRIPRSVTHLRVTFQFPGMLWECPFLDYDTDVLGHLSSLALLVVVVSFPTPGVGVLVRRLLGAPRAHLRAVSLRAEHQAASAHLEVLDEMLAEDVDPVDDEFVDLQLIVSSIRAGCLVPSGDVVTALETFVGAQVQLLGFPTTHPVQHPRLIQ